MAWVYKWAPDARQTLERGGIDRYKGVSQLEQVSAIWQAGTRSANFVTEEWFCHAAIEKNVKERQI